MDKVLEKEHIMANDFDYYLIGRDNKFMSPLLMNDDEINSGGTAFLRRLQKVDDKNTIHLVFNPPIPKKPDMTDYLWLTFGAVFSKKIYDVLKNIDIKDFQLVPAIIKDPKGKEYSDYWIAGVYKEYAFLDPNKSEVNLIRTEGRMAGRWDGIKKMVIDEKEMAKISLEERLIYKSKESNAYNFYHKSIVDKIMEVNPTGIVFVPVEEWKN
jgi:hypothetical protein